VQRGVARFTEPREEIDELLQRLVLAEQRPARLPFCVKMSPEANRRVSAARFPSITERTRRSASSRRRSSRTNERSTTVARVRRRLPAACPIAFAIPSPVDRNGAQVSRARTAWST
jgi:hypothetical protein